MRNITALALGVCSIPSAHTFRSSPFLHTVVLLNENCLFANMFLWYLILLIVIEAVLQIMHELQETQVFVPIWHTAFQGLFSSLTSHHTI